MGDIKWDEIFFGSESPAFLLEILFRTIIMYVFILVALRSSGRRGVKQLSIFETVIIIGLGSAAGDPMLYKEVGVLYAVVVFVVLIGLYRLTIYFTAKSRSFEKLMEGKPTFVVKDGKFSIKDFDRELLSQDEFFAELRMMNVEHLGQVKSAILETSGEVSLLFQADEAVKYGLPLLIDIDEKQSVEINKKNYYACAFCGNVAELQMAAVCEICDNNKWVEAINTKRIA